VRDGAAGDADPPPVTATALRKRFGPVAALDGLDLSLRWGEVTALVGPNGAGKTTLLLVLSGLLAPDSGHATVAGLDTVGNPKKVHALLGWMPDFFGIYDDLTSREYLELFGAAYRMDRASAKARTEQLIDEMNLGSLADARVHTLSRGQKQKIGFARSIIHSPRVLLLDEPASGLDPHARIDLRDMVRDQASKGVAVVISSHILHELEEMADRVVFMERGRCHSSYAMGELPSVKGTRQWRARSLDPEVLGQALLSAGVPYETQANGSVVLAVGNEVEAADLARRLIEQGVALVEFAPQRGTIEQAFLSLAREASS
jgi:ABC-2 type transport system ATP-binding protein